jgi:hypothetical protein
MSEFRVMAVVTVLIVGIVLAACGQTATAPVPAKPESTPTAAHTPTPTPGLVLLDISGSDSHQSNMFTAPGTWDIIWQAQADPNTTGSFIAINVYDPKGNPVAETISANLDPGAMKSDVVHMHYAGTVYLQIQCVSTWHIKAVTT